jgi:CBS domain-containing protein
MQVREIMTKNPECCGENSSALEVARMMADCDCGEIPVVDDHGRPVGVVTDRDIALRVVAAGKEPRETDARQIMSTPVITVTPESSIEELCRIAEEHQIRRIPVVNEKGEICGIVAQADIARKVPEVVTGGMVKDVSQPASRAH